jgi:hypothetical protein
MDSTHDKPNTPLTPGVSGQPSAGEPLRPLGSPVSSAASTSNTARAFTPTLYTLSPDDGRALDALLETRAAQDSTGRTAAQAGFRLAASPSNKSGGAADDRARRVEAVLHLLDQCPAEDPPADLLERAMTGIANQRQKDRFARQVESVSTPPVAFRWTELIAVAAVLLIGVSLMWPVLSHSRSEARKAECQANLGAAGAAMGSYAHDHNGYMPHAAIAPGATWWGVGQTASATAPAQSNSTHLFLLVRGGYITSGQLSCPENGNAPRNLSPEMCDWPNPPALSYSYQNQFTTQPQRLADFPQMAVLADKNPLFAVSAANPRALQFRRELALDTPSALHSGRGQNVLLAGGSASWDVSPIVKHDGMDDNIWAVNGVTSYNGTQVPTQPGDAHLVP